jgi:hypothetical protein
MSKDWVKDMRDMASKYNIQEAVNNLDRNELRSFLKIGKHQVIKVITEN